MSTFFSKSTGGFYDSDINGSDIPSDALEISAETHMALLGEQAQGKAIVAGEDGLPYAVVPQISIERLADIAKEKRDSLLCGSDWITLRSLEASTPLSAAWLNYRQSLRDLPAQPGFPTQIDWPEAPNA